jgi:L-lysine cyclodeaminase
VNGTNATAPSALSSSLERFLAADARGKVLLLSHEDVLLVLQSVGVDAFMDAMIARVRDALRSSADSGVEVVARGGFSFDGPCRGLVEWMPVLVPPAAVIVKMIGYHPDNRLHFDLPTIVGTTGLYDGRTGSLRALIDGTVMTAVRTGAASAVASQVLAIPDARSLGLIGCGGQAVTQLHALSRLYAFTRILAYDVDPTVAASLAARVERLGLTVTAVPRATIEREADIICTQTSALPGAEPVLDAAHLKPWVHVNAVGSDSVGKVELPQELLEASLVCPDFLEQAVVEGECQRVAAERIGPDLSTLVKHPERYVEWRQRRTVFDSTGFALEDAVAMDLLLHAASRLALGREISLEGAGRDSLNPYATATRIAAAVPVATLT